MGRVWAVTGRPALAARAGRSPRVSRLAFTARSVHRTGVSRTIALRLTTLLSGEPFQQLTASRDGTYWNP